MPLDRATLLPHFKSNAHEVFSAALQKIHTEITIENLAELHRAFHSIGSAAGMMQLPEILKNCRSFEAQCNDFLTSKILPNTDQLKTFYNGAELILHSIDMVTL